MAISINERTALPAGGKYGTKALVGAMGLSATPEAQAAWDVLRKYGTDAHVYIPGIGNPVGIRTGNYQLSTGTDAATDQPVGLSLDAVGSVGPVLFEANNVTAGATAAGAAISGLAATIAITSGKTYLVTYQVTSLVGQLSSSIAAAVYGPAGSVNQTGGFVDYLVATATGSYSFGLYARGAGVTSVTGSVSVREVAGIHASQTTSGFRPVLRRVPVLGPELVTNGDFSSGLTGWNVSGGASPYNVTSSAGTLDFAGSTSYINVDNSALTASVIGKTYLAKFTLTARTAGTIRVSLGSAFGASRSVVGYYEELLTATTTNRFLIQDTAGTFVGSVDNISVKEVLGYKDVWYWQFDGTDDRLSLGSVPFQMSDDHAVVCGLRSDNGGVVTALCVACNSASGTQYVARVRTPSSGQIAVDWRDDAATNILLQSSAGATPTGTAFVVSARNTGGTKIGRLNGSQFGTSSVSQGATTVNTSAIGSFQGSSANYWNGPIYAVIAIKGTVSDADLKTLEKWVGQLSGVQIQ